MPNQDKDFFDKIYKMWDEGENQREVINEYYEYYTGENYQNPADSFFVKEKRTNCNIINQIVEAKLNAMLEANFTASVVPEICSFANLSGIQNMQAVADVLDKGLKKILERNKHDEIKEKVGRWGFIRFGASQVSWDDMIEGGGDVVIDDLDPRNLRWTKGCKKIEDLTWIGYCRDLDIALAKHKYARNPDGSYNLDLCKLLDQASGFKPETDSSGQDKAYGAYIQNNADTGAALAAGLGYIKDSVSRGQGKNVTVVVMFMFDASLETPDEDDLNDEEPQLSAQYPNGRIVVFVPDQDKHLILIDEQASEAFKSYGNIDIFTTKTFDAFYKGDDVEMLIPIQERINGTYRKLRSCVGGDIASILFDERMRGVVDDGSLVNLPVQFIEGLGSFQPSMIENNMIEKALSLKELIEAYKQEARETARVNQTWMSGMQQQGVQSGAHADALNESALESIRSIQRNFKNYYVSMCEKIVALMIENYTQQRLLEISVGVGQKQYAMFDTQTGEDGQPQQSMMLINQAGQITKEIKLDSSWKFKVNVVDGIEIPRSRKENAMLVDQIVASPIMNSGNIDLIDIYLIAKDFPGRRALVELLKQQKQQAQNKKWTMQDIMMNPTASKSLSEMIDALAKAGMNADISAMLKFLGLTGKPGDLTDTPIEKYTSRSDVKDVSVIAPMPVDATNPQRNLEGKQIAGAIIDLDLGVGSVR